MPCPCRCSCCPDPKTMARISHHVRTEHGNYASNAMDELSSSQRSTILPGLPERDARPDTLKLRIPGRQVCTTNVNVHPFPKGLHLAQQRKTWSMVGSTCESTATLDDSVTGRQPVEDVKSPERMNSKKAKQKATQSIDWNNSSLHFDNEAEGNTSLRSNQQPDPTKHILESWPLATSNSCPTPYNLKVTNSG